jgi:hypothetical protein
MGLTKHLARSRCLVADDLLFAAIAFICKYCVANDANLRALRGREFRFLRVDASRRRAICHSIHKGDDDGQLRDQLET